MKMFFDTETTGFPVRNVRNKEYFDPSITKYYNTSRIVQLAYIIDGKKDEKDEKESGLIIKRNFIIKPESFTIENSHIHNITQEYAIENGVEIKYVLDVLYEDIKTYSDITLIAHNLEFDYNILLSECYRENFEELIFLLKKANKYCTMEKGKEKLKLNKLPKLTELYEKLFSESFLQKHDALDDAEYCMKCYNKIEITH